MRICRTWREACQAAGVEYREAFDRQAADPAAREARRVLVRRYEIGAIGTEEFIEAVAGATAGLYSAEEFRAIHEAWILDEYPGVAGLIDDLHAAGVQTGVLSNTNALHWRQLTSGPHGPAKFPTPEKVRHLHASHLLGLAKPDAAVFERFARAVGAPAADAGGVLFFDDLEDNVRGAQSAGWRAHLVDHSGDTAGQMRAVLTAAGALAAGR